jgi:uncharacterized membrane protein YdfJ with MMPL/SSD domain
MRRRGATERMAGWSMRHGRLAAGLWVAFVAACLVGGSLAGLRELTDSESSAGETARAEKMIEQARFRSRASETVLVQSGTVTVHDPRFRRVVTAVVARLAAQPDVVALDGPFASKAAGQVSADGRSALVQFDVRGPSGSASERIAPVLAAVAGVARTHPRFFVGELGDASVDYQLGRTIDKDFGNAERLSIPITLLILVFTFGALVAAGVPVLLAFSAVLATVGLDRLVSHVVPADDATQSIILLIGMAVGVDYSLFYLKREREERRATLGLDRAAVRAAQRGLRNARRSADEAAVAGAREVLAVAKARSRANRRAALEVAAATSGRAVLVSGATVLVAMAGMLLTGDATFTSVGVGAMLVVFATMVGSLTVLPAVLALLGDHVERGRIPLLGRLAARRSGTGWARIVRAATQRPVVAVVLAGGALVALAAPAAGLRTALPGFSSLPASIPVVRTYDRMQAAFPGASAPADVVIRASSVRAPAVRSGIARLERAAHDSDRMGGPVETAVNPAGTVAQVWIPLRGSGEDQASYAALETLRTRIVPQTIGAVPGVEAAVTGETAGSHDFTAEMHRTIPLVFAFVLGLAFLLLLVTFRSLVIPATAIVLNLLSVAAAYGALVLVFQHGVGAGLIGVHHTSAIVTWLPLFLFVILFGLSMDYHVFIVSRIKELRDAGMATEDAVAEGIARTAGTVTSAAAVMIGVFSIFATLSTVDMKQVGVGLAGAILIDATIVRAVLLPATMKLLGERNWYLPSFLEWLPSAGRRRLPQPGES